MTFIEAVKQGKAKPEDIDDWVDKWHGLECWRTDTPLHEYLGLTWEEYGEWVRDPDAIYRILEVRVAIYNFGPTRVDWEDLLKTLDVDNCLWVVCDYEFCREDWRGEGYVIMLRKDGILQYKSIDHHSGYGPMDGWEDATEISIEEFFRVKESIFDDDWSDEAKTKVAELLNYERRN